VTASLVRVSNVTKRYRLGAAVIDALRGVSVDIAAGEFLAISGPSGSGKTTLLNLIGCIERPTSGSVSIGDVETASLSDNQSAALRATKLSFIFQNFNLLPVLTALENVEYPLLGREMSSSVRRQMATAALERVGLSSHLAHKPMELSGGQRQRVAIARAVVTRPALILADEPTANLDHENSESVLNLMQELNSTLGTTFVFSTHDPRVMRRSSRILPLCDGLVENA
jgi:putative ABC transport system ATP-binding protein